MLVLLRVHKDLKAFITTLLFSIVLVQTNTMVFFIPIFYLLFRLYITQRTPITPRTERERPGANAYPSQPSASAQVAQGRGSGRREEKAAESYPEGIGQVIAGRHHQARKEPKNYPRNLLLIRPAKPRNGLLHLTRRILVDYQTSMGRKYI